MLMLLENMRAFVLDSSVDFFSPPLYLFLYRCCFLFVWAELSLLTADYSQAAFPFVCQNFKKEVKVNSLFGITGRMSAGKTK